MIPTINGRIRIVLFDIITYSSNMNEDVVQYWFEEPEKITITFSEILIKIDLFLSFVSLYTL